MKTSTINNGLNTIASEIVAYNIININSYNLNSADIKPVVICGFCGAREHYISNGKTECPNCDEFLD